jgi:hypothetical protein
VGLTTSDFALDRCLLRRAQPRNSPILGEAFPRPGGLRRRSERPGVFERAAVLLRAAPRDGVCLLDGLLVLNLAQDARKRRIRLALAAFNATFCRKQLVRDLLPFGALDRVAVSLDLLPVGDG